MSRNHLRKIFIFLSLMFNASLHAYPVSFRRFALIDEHDNLIKTVDLIGDTHIPIREMVRNPSRYQREFLSNIEKDFFSTTERTLLIALRQLNKKPGRIDLLWEVTKGPSNIYHATFIQPFIKYGGFILQENFKNNKGSIQFHNVDTFRAMMGPDGLYLNALYIYLDTGTIQANFRIRDFKESLEQIIQKASKVSEDISSLEKSLSPNIYIEIKKESLAIQDILKKIIKKIIDPALEKNPDMLFDEFAKNLTTEQEVDLETVIIEQLPESEMLIKIYSSDASHVILYAGDTHTRRISNGWDYPLEIEIKPIFKNITVPLSHRVWLLLLQPPQESFKKLKQREKKTWIFNEKDRAKEFYTFFSILENMESDNKKQEDFINEQLEPFLKESTSHGYFNFIEARRNDNNETLLFYAVRNNLLRIVEFLVNHGARINTANRTGKTPVHFAAALPDPAIFFFLENHGASLTIKDDFGKTPIDYITKWNQNIRNAYQQYLITKKPSAQTKRKAPEITTTTTTTSIEESSEKRLR